jgi:prevent-host-death family protein
MEEATAPLADYVATVETGEEVVITRDGTPVAKLMPISVSRRLTSTQAAALARTLERAEQGYSSSGWRFNRDELHDR